MWIANTDSAEIIALINSLSTQKANDEKVVQLEDIKHDNHATQTPSNQPYPTITALPHLESIRKAIQSFKI